MHSQLTQLLAQQHHAELLETAARHRLVEPTETPRHGTVSVLIRLRRGTRETVIASRPTMSA
jgi:hypothetical protein